MCAHEINSNVYRIRKTTNHTGGASGTQIDGLGCGDLNSLIVGVRRQIGQRVDDGCQLLIVDLGKRRRETTIGTEVASVGEQRMFPYPLVRDCQRTDFRVGNSRLERQEYESR